MVGHAHSAARTRSASSAARHPTRSARLRRYLEDHQYLSRNPTAAELEALEQARDEGSRLALWRGRRARLVP